MSWENEHWSSPNGCHPDCPVCNAEITFCENTLCENEAVKTVPVSENKPGDSERSFCAPCEEAYTIGVQHGRMANSDSLLAWYKRDFIRAIVAANLEVNHGS